MIILTLLLSLNLWARDYDIPADVRKACQLRTKTSFMEGQTPVEIFTLAKSYVSETLEDPGILDDVKLKLAPTKWCSQKPHVEAWADETSSTRMLPF